MISVVVAVGQQHHRGAGWSRMVSFTCLAATPAVGWNASVLLQKASRLLGYSGFFDTVAEMFLEGKSKSLALGVTQCYVCLILLTNEALRDTQIQG